MRKTTAGTKCPVLSCTDPGGTLRVKSLVTGTAAIATVIAMQLSGLSAASAAPVTPASVASANAEATHAQSIADEAAKAAAKSADALADKKAEAAKEATKAAEAVAKAAASGKAADQTKADAAVARAADFAAKAASAQVDYNEKAADAAAKAAIAAAAATNAGRESASLASVKGGASTEGTTTKVDDPQGLVGAIHSDNVEVIGNVRGQHDANISCGVLSSNPVKCPSFAGLNFVTYDGLGYDMMFAIGTAGLSVFSLKDPAHPQFISQVNLAALNAAGNQVMTQFWENENLTIDSKRMIAWLTRDSTQARGLFPIDISDPWNPKVIGFHKVPQGHTATCLNDCTFIWSVGGITLPTENPDGFRNKPSMVAVTDVRDVNHPYTYPSSFAANVHRSGVVTGSTHSVDVDFEGVAWVSASRGVRGFYTDGKHLDPATGVSRWATPYNPISYGGGAVAGSDTAFMHNAYRFPHKLGNFDKGDVMLIGNEINNGSCTSAGKFIFASVKGTRDAIDNVGTPAAPAKMARLATYSPGGKPGEKQDATGKQVGDCSAHWFTVKGNIVAMSFYEQGTRFIDVSDPTNPVQVGYFRVPGIGTGATPEQIFTDTSATYWHGDYVYVSDYGRGVDVIKFTGDIPGQVDTKVCWNACDK